MMKSSFKRVLYAIAVILVSPLICAYFLARQFGGGDRAFQGFSQVLSLLPTRLGVYLRAAFYGMCCADVHQEVTVGFLTLFSHADTDIGKNVYIGPQSNIGSCAIGADCLLGSGVHVLSGKRQHDFSDLGQPIREQGGNLEKVQIGADCWIGNQATIMANLGAGSIVAAGAVVVEDMPAHVILAGNPARVLRKRT